ncbi:MAG: hypothetical protein LBU88_08590 [Treponema sp.]|nr:hypothetical protein [Treponema sp.]
MKNISKVILIIVIILNIASCNTDMYYLLTRTQDDPSIVPPRLQSFVISYAIIAEWDKDEAADEYLLERSEDNPIELIYETVYKGTNTGYTDNGLVDGVRYIYRLSKRRGEKWFGPSEGALGVGSQITRNSHSNNTKETALKLESKGYVSNLYYFRSYCGLEMTTEAWYYIDIPAIRKASLMVLDYGIGEQASGTQTHFNYYVFEREFGSVINLLDFWIENHELETERYYVKLYPSKSSMIWGLVPAGGKIVQYRITIQGIVPIGAGG